MSKRRPNGAREREARRLGFPEYDSLTIDQLHNERKSLGLRAADLGKQMREITLRTTNLRLRLRAAKQNEPGIGISDHAVIRYLERVKGVDLAAVRAEIRARIAAKEIGPDKDQVVEDEGVSFAIYDGQRLSTVWTAPACREPSDAF